MKIRKIASIVHFNSTETNQELIFNNSNVKTIPSYNQFGRIFTTQTNRIFELDCFKNLNVLFLL